METFLVAFQFSYRTFRFEKAQTLFQFSKILLQSAISKDLYLLPPTKTKVKKKHKIFAFNLQMIYLIYLAKKIEFIFLL